MQLTNKSGNKHTVYPCRNNCGNLTLKNGSRCLQCYKKELKQNKEFNLNHHNQNVKETHQVVKRKKYPCKNCGELIYEFNSLCRKCYDKARHIQGELRQIAKNKQLADTQARIERNRVPVKVSVCYSHESPNQRHFEIIDTSTNIGKCKYCGHTRDYNKLQNRDFKEKVYGGRKK